MASSDGKGTTPDLMTKYNKLATEYAKLRAQLPVLKRAVLEEQGKNEQVSTTLQLREQSIRKLEQEVDSLNFRNKQLEKRIGVLQNELTELSTKGAKGKKHQKDKDKDGVGQGQGEGSSSGGAGGSLDYELVAKIEENMNLQKQLSDLEMNSTFEIETLKSQLESLSNEETHKELILNELAALKSENQSLTFALQNSLDEIEAYREQVDQMKEKLASPVQVPEVLVKHVVEKPETPASLPKGQEQPPDLLDKLKRSEQERERGSIEHQLLKMKYDRIFKKWEECRDILRSLGKGDLIQGCSSEVTTPVVEPSNLLGKIDIINEEGDTVDINGRSYEREVKEHMEKKVDELVSLLQYADSRAVHFYQECQAMQSLLALSCEKRHVLEEQIDSLKSIELNLKEELDLTKGNYENQLTQLSEHLAIMNDKIAEKQELINGLQTKLKNKK